MGRVLQVVSRAVIWLEEQVLSGSVLLLAFLTLANVIGRSLFGQSLASAEELSRFLIVLLTFVGLGYGASKGRHIRMTAFYDQLPERPRKAMMLIISGTTALLLGAFTWLAFRYVLGTVRPLGAVSPVLEVPVYLVYLAAPLGLLLATVQYALAFLRNLTTPGVYLSWRLREDEAAGEEPVPSDP
jgi:TRAP-type C4-dicarboxylate transport system permease small subunit